jgi:hypothetical protein
MTRAPAPRNHTLSFQSWISHLDTSAAFVLFDRGIWLLMKTPAAHYESALTRAESEAAAAVKSSDRARRAWALARVSIAPDLAPSAADRRTASVAKLQRAFKRYNLGHIACMRLFAPHFLHGRDGLPAAHGKVQMGANLASFVRLAAGSDASQVAQLVRHHWGLAQPELVISVTGGASTLEISDDVKRAFEAGFVRAAERARAWVVTGATDAGVMRLVAQAVHRHNVAVPVIGIVPFLCVKGHDKLARCAGGHVDYMANDPAREASVAAASQLAQLSPHHTHFVLVDSPPRADGKPPWSSELPLRYAFERAVMEQTQALNVQVVHNRKVVTRVLVSASPGTFLLWEPRVLVSASSHAAGGTGGHAGHAGLYGERRWDPLPDRRRTRVWRRGVGDGDVLGELLRLLAPDAGGAAEGAPRATLAEPAREQPRRRARGSFVRRASVGRARRERPRDARSERHRRAARRSARRPAAAARLDAARLVRSWRRVARRRRPPPVRHRE